MVYVDKNCLSYTDYFKWWSNQYNDIILESEEKLSVALDKLFDKIIPTLILFIYDGITPDNK